jgi:adenylate cyclase
MALYGLREEGMQKGSRDALFGAQEMFRRLDLLNKRIKPEFDITIQMGIGIHAGTAIVGRMGPPQSPLLTAIGDNINIAARLESMTKIEGCDVIVSLDAITASGFSNQSLSRVTLDVRGRAEGIEVVKLMRDELSDFLNP